MFNEKTAKLEKAQFTEAESIAYLIKDKRKRKYAFLNICALFALKNYIEKNNYMHKPITKTNLFRVPAIYEKFEFSDLYIGSVRLDVRVSLNGETFEIPKTQIKNSLAADFYVVLQPTRTPLKCEILGYIKKDDLIFDSQDEHYYHISTSILNPIQALKEESQNLKKPIRNFFEIEHKRVVEEFGIFLDGNLDDVRSQDMIEHLVICEECRGNLVEYSFLEDALISANKYADLRATIELELEKPINKRFGKTEELYEDDITEEYDIVEEFETMDVNSSEPEFISNQNDEVPEILEFETKEEEQTSVPEFIVESENVNEDNNSEEELIETETPSEGLDIDVPLNEQPSEITDEEDFVIKEEDINEPDKYSIVENTENEIPIIEEENINVDIKEENSVENTENEIPIIEEENINVDIKEEDSVENTENEIPITEEENINIDIKEDDFVENTENENPIIEEENISIEIKEEDSIENTEEHVSQNADTEASDTETLSIENPDTEILNTENDSTETYVIDEINPDIFNVVEQPKAFEPYEFIPAQSVSYENNEPAPESSPNENSFWNTDVQNSGDENSLPPVEENVPNFNTGDEFSNQIETMYKEENTQSDKEADVISQEITSNVANNKSPKGALIAIFGVFVLIVVAVGAALFIFKPAGLPGITNNNNEEISENASAETSPDMNQSLANAFSNNGQTLKVTNVSWEKDKSLDLTTELKEYLSALGGTIWDDLDMDIKSVQGYIASSAAKITIKINKNGEVDDIQLSQSCGAEEVDNVIIQTVKNATQSLPPSSYSIKGKNIKFYLLVNF